MRICNASQSLEAYRLREQGYRNACRATDYNHMLNIISPAISQVLPQTLSLVADAYAFKTMSSSI